MKLIALIFIAVLLSACGAPPANNTTSSNASNATNSATPATQILTVVEAPQRVKDMMASRGEQDSAQPTLKIIEPAANSTVSGSTVKVKLALSGDLKGYQPHKDPATQMGNHIHVILDNQPYEAYYEIDGAPFELRNVADGEHTLRVFPSRPWHESYKNAGAFQMVKFTVKNGGAEANKPATTNSGQQMSNSNANANTAPSPEGKDMTSSTGGAVDAAKPLLTYSRPKGEYKAAESDPIMIDFWLENAKLKGDGGQYRVRYTIDGGEAKFIDKWTPTWLSGWTAGKHTIKLELVDEAGNLVDNGGYNSTTREITVSK
jgi:PBP1b-binding outer membrane lipoprotein LpoB